MNLLILLQATSPDWFIWFDVEAHKIILPITGIIAAGATIYQLSKTRRIVDERQKELNELNTQTTHLASIVDGMDSQIGELSTHTTHLTSIVDGMNSQIDELKALSKQQLKTNEHLEDSIGYQSKILEQSIESAKLDSIREKQRNRPIFEEFPDDCFTSPLGTQIALINKGGNASIISIENQDPQGMVTKYDPKTVATGETLKLTIAKDAFVQFNVVFADVNGVKYSQSVLGYWRSVTVMNPVGIV